MKENSVPFRVSALDRKAEHLGGQIEQRGGWRVAAVYSNPETEAAAVREGVGVADISPMRKLALKGKAASALLQETFGEAPEKVGDVLAVEFDDTEVLAVKLVSDEFLILASPGMQQITLEYLKERQDGRFITILDRTAGLAGLVVAGPKSNLVFRKCCALSFHSEDFPSLYAAQSSVAKVRTIILRHDRGEIPAFELFFDRAYAEYIWDALMDAGKEFGIQPFGWQTSQLLKK